MVSPTSKQAPREPEPAWDIARLFPGQGQWNETEYLILTDLTNLLVELTDGYVEVLPMPRTSHQFIVQYLSNLLLTQITARSLGWVLFAPLVVRLRTGMMRQPDIVFMAAEHKARMTDDYLERPDLVVEVTSPDKKSRQRDLVKKREEYAQAGVAEYWIVDAQEKRVTVLKLRGKKYVVHADSGAGETCSSALLKGIEVDVTMVLEAGELPT